MRLDELLEEFATHVVAQTAAMAQGDARKGNRHARRYVAAAKELRGRGAEGLNAFATLLRHADMDVRSTAAVYLLPERTAEAKAVLEEAAKGQGMLAFGASQALKRWEEGAWALDQ